MKIAKLALILAVTAALVAGCGDDGNDDAAGNEAESAPLAEGNAVGGNADGEGNTAADDDQSPAPTPAKASYVRQVSQICARDQQAILAGIVRIGQQTEEQDATALFESVTSEVLIPALGQKRGDIRALGAPSGDEQRVEAILDSLEQGQASLEDEPPTAIEGYAERLQDFDRLARQYGIKGCAPMGS